MKSHTQDARDAVNSETPSLRETCSLTVNAKIATLSTLSMKPGRANRHHGRINDGEPTGCDDFEVKSPEKQFGSPSCRRFD